VVFKAIPVLRIFDEDIAKEFYLDYLGMNIDWEYRLEPGLPVYIQVSKGKLIFHLSEHSSECTPGSKVFVETNGLDNLFKEITSKSYKYSNPAIEDAPWGARTFTVIDPFSNKILFSESR
jgi:hypothetical protein